MSSSQRLTILDALRGVAAFIVLWYHSFEGFATSIEVQVCAHGFLAVDFFFLLSGFVTGYAYDARWQEGWSFRQFFLRRLIRLHPMVVVGVAVGLICFLLGGAVNWYDQQASVWAIVSLTLMSLFLIPSLPGMATEVRGFGEAFPLNGPHWSLFFEYLGNIFYALSLRRLKTRTLGCLAALMALLYVAVVGLFGRCDFGWGFIMYDLPGSDVQLSGFFFGLIRLLFPYTAGLYLSRLFACRKASGPSRRRATLVFAVCALTLVVLLGMPYLAVASFVEPLYLIACNLVVFPLIVWIGACAGHGGGSFMRFLGDISYPLYAVHYPAFYLVDKYIGFPNPHATPGDVWQWTLLIVVMDVAMAWLLMRFYDAPIRKWLTNQLHASAKHHA